MPVKGNSSGARMLAVFEEVARAQPVGLSELARALGDDRSAVQRALVTLAEAGWIAPAPGAAARWRPSDRIAALAGGLSDRDALRCRAAGELARLRDESGESVLLTLLDGGGFVVAEAWESRQLLRTAPIVGMAIASSGTATARAVLAHLPPDRQRLLLGTDPAPAEREAIALARARGFAVSEGDVVAGATSIGAAVIDRGGAPAGAVVISGPSERLANVRWAEIGAMVAAAARRISLGERMPFDQ